MLTGWGIPGLEKRLQATQAHQPRITEIGSQGPEMVAQTPQVLFVSRAVHTVSSPGQEVGAPCCAAQPQIQQVFTEHLPCDQHWAACRGHWDRDCPLSEGAHTVPCKRGAEATALAVQGDRHARRLSGVQPGVQREPALQRWRGWGGLCS